MTNLRTLLLPGLALACLIAAGSRHGLLIEARRQHGLVAMRSAEESQLPPSVALITVAFGGFRGLIADVLWLRVSHLQEKGATLEIVQLADFITKLQPRFADVWVFHAWNMAYNVSFSFPNGPDRWRWIKNGVELLRDDGIRLNPDSAALYLELAWFFQHKIGGGAGTASDRFHIYYKQQLAAEFSEWLGESPAIQEQRLGDPAVAGRLRREFGMDPESMRILTRFYGTLDWRLPYAHAIYWAYQGHQRAEGSEQIRSNRMLFQSVYTAMKKGRLVEDSNLDLFATAPSLEVIPRLGIMHEQAMQAFGEGRAVEQYQRFLAEAALLLCEAGRQTEAKGLHARYLQLVTEDTAQPSFERFIYDRYFLQRDAVHPKAVGSGIVQVWSRHFYWQAVGDAGYTDGTRSLAGILHRVATESGSTDSPESDLRSTGRELALRDMPPALRARLSDEHR